jgi:hypothetical protein
MRIICVDFDGTTVRAVRYKDGDATGFDSDCSGSGFTSTSDYTQVSDTDGMYSERGVLLGKNLINNSDNNRVAIHVNLSLHGDEGAVGFLSGLGGGSAYSKQVNVKVMPGSAYHSLSGISSLTSDGGVYFMSQYQGAGAQIDDMVIGIYGHQ